MCLWENKPGKRRVSWAESDLPYLGMLKPLWCFSPADPAPLVTGEDFTQKNPVISG